MLMKMTTAPLPLQPLTPTAMPNSLFHQISRIGSENVYIDRSFLSDQQDW
jgi:hypothetical protein